MTEKLITKDLYYTRDHEWIDFQSSVAYVGVCKFKLCGFKAIHEIIFNVLKGFLRQGEIIATIKYNDYQVDVHMPVDGKLVQVNEEFVSGNKDALLQEPENGGWVALILPAQPYDRKTLLQPCQYQENRSNKFTKAQAVHSF